MEKNEISEKLNEQIIQYLSFYIGSELYGIEVDHVKEVIEYYNVYPVPLTPDYIKGIINLRGEVLPVIDLNFLLFEKKTILTQSSSIIFVECFCNDEILVVGIIADSVDAVLDISKNNMTAAPEFGEKIPSRYIKGIAKNNGSFIILLNIMTMLNIDELSRFSDSLSGTNSVNRLV